MYLKNEMSPCPAIMVEQTNWEHMMWESMDCRQVFVLIQNKLKNVFNKSLLPWIISRCDLAVSFSKNAANTFIYHLNFWSLNKKQRKSSNKNEFEDFYGPDGIFGPIKIVQFPSFVCFFWVVSHAFCGPKNPSGTTEMLKINLMSRVW